MTSKNSTLFVRLREISRELWVRVTAFSVAAVLLAALASWVGPYMPDGFGFELASGAVDDILNILAASMLTVTTFSVSIMVTAYGSATSNATPRATRLLAEDNAAQTAVGVFIGSFLFSIVGIVGLAMGLYQGNSRVLLFLATLGDIALITWALLRWVDHLNSFGRMHDIVSRIERVATTAAERYRDRPALGAIPGTSPLSTDAATVASRQHGYVRAVDMMALQGVAADQNLIVEMLRMPGKYVHEGEPLLRLSREVEDDVANTLRDAVLIGNQRSFDEDVGYGLIVLSEVASRALSPAVNDPGSAIDALRAGTRVLMALHGTPSDDAAQSCDRVYAPEPDLGAIYASFFSSIARDGAGLIEVQETLLDCLAALSQVTDQPYPQIEAERAKTRALAALDQAWERDRLNAA